MIKAMKKRCACGNKPPAPISARILSSKQREDFACAMCCCRSPADIEIHFRNATKLPKIKLCLPHYVDSIRNGDPA